MNQRSLEDILQTTGPVEQHEQIEIRAEVSPTPYSQVARETYARGWRNRAAR